MRTRRILGAALAAMALVVIVPAEPANAVPGLPIDCTAAGTLETVSGPLVTQWRLVGGGSCSGDLEGTYVLPNLLAQGTSDSIGLCGEAGDGVVTNLRLVPTGTLVNLARPMASKTLAGQVWRADVTTYPLATPFLIYDSLGNQIGQGAIFSRIFGQCPAVGGSPVMTIRFSFVPPQP
jgi:hypothetical protein